MKKTLLLLVPLSAFIVSCKNCFDCTNCDDEANEKELCRREYEDIYDERSEFREFVREYEDFYGCKCK